MFSIIRSYLRFSPAGVVAIIALVFAMIGGAFAAAGEPGSSATASKAKKGPPGPRGKKGATGATGAAGAAGPAGLAGPQGPAGANGKDGAPGAPGEDGVDGEDGTFSTEPLPSGESLTGAWGTSGGPNAQAPNGDLSMVSISFPISVSPAPSPAPSLFVQFDVGSELGYLITDGTVTPSAEFEAECPGSFAEPEAEPGFLCVYLASKQNANLSTTSTSLLESAHPFGVVIPFDINAGGSYAKGSWAVTAE